MSHRDFPSTGVTKNDLSKPIYNTLVEVALKVSQHRLVVSDDDIDVIRSARDEAMKTVSSHFDAMISTAEERRLNLKKYEGIRFVSLGCDGFINILLSRWGMIAASECNTGPFDRLDLSPNSISAAISNDFRDFTSVSLSSSAERSEAHPMLRVLQSGITNQGSTGQSVEADIATKIENFRNWMGSGDPTVFVFHSNDASLETQKSVSYTFNTIQRSRAEFKTLCMWIYTPNPGSQSVDWFLNPDLLILQASYPLEGYTWNLPIHTFSWRGQTFEAKLVQGIKILLQEYGFPPPTR